MGLIFICLSLFAGWTVAYRWHYLKKNIIISLFLLVNVIHICGLLFYWNIYYASIYSIIFFPFWIVLLIRPKVTKVEILKKYNTLFANVAYTHKRLLTCFQLIILIGNLYDLIYNNPFIENFIARRIISSENPMRYFLSQILNFSNITNFFFLFSFYLFLLDKKQVPYLTLFVINSILLGIKDTSKSGVIFNLMNLFIPYFYLHTKRAYRLLPIAILISTIGSIIVASKYLGDNTEFNLTDVCRLIIYRAFVSEIEAFPIIVDNFFYEYNLFILEFSRIFYHLGFGHKKPLASEVVFNLFSKDENLYGDMGFSSAMSMPGYLVFNIGLLAPIMVFLFSVNLFYFNSILRNTLLNRNFLLFVIILQPFFIYFYYNVPGGGHVFLSLENIVTKIITNCLAFILLTFFFQLYQLIKISIKQNVLSHE